MLRRVAIVLYAVALISLYANAHADKTKQASNSQSPSQPTSAAPVQQHDGASLQSKDEQHVNADVKVVALPGKDWQDVFTFWISVVLAVVGIAGVGIGICTLIFLRNQTRHIRRQADMAARQARLISTQAHQMGEQTEIFRDSVAAAQKAADAALLQAALMKEQSDLITEKDRAKLRIEMDRSGPIKDQYGSFKVRGWLSIYGNSEAFIRYSEIYASIGPAGIFNPLPEWSWRIHNVPEVIRPNAEPISFEVMVMSDDGPAEEAEMVPVFKREVEIHCMAKIEFFDAYGRNWGLSLRRRFVFAWHEGVEGYLGGEWENSGPATENGEYRTEDQRQKPN